MENFNWTAFARRIAIQANLADIYKAWTTSAAIEQWFLSKADFFDRDKHPVDRHKPVEKGFSYEWSWYLFDTVEKGRITEANGTDFLQFTFAGECLVDIRLKPDGEYVIVELTQKNIPTDDQSKRDIRLGCDSGWSFYLVNLKSVLEGGPDLRNKDTRLKAMVNN